MSPVAGSIPPEARIQWQGHSLQLSSSPRSRKPFCLSVTRYVDGWQSRQATRLLACPAGRPPRHGTAQLPRTSGDVRKAGAFLAR
eukprot:12353016-Heterocapsa_arctica.AAC.1